MPPWQGLWVLEMTEDITCEQAAALLRGWDHILVLSHTSPDGDTLGSAAALIRGLHQLGKQASFACSEEPDRKYEYLFEGIPHHEDAIRHVVTVDVADKCLLGSLEREYGDRVELAIDHHGTHKEFSEKKWVEPASASTTEMIALLLETLGVKLDKPMAGSIYTGLTTDTGCFRYRNVTPRTHRVAAQMLEAGADGGEINRKMFESKSRRQVEAERRVLDTMEFFCEGKCAMVFVPQLIYRETGAVESDLDGVATLPRQVEGVILGITLKERESGEIKVSVRSNPPANAAKLCEKFGGGGHPGAAGCSFPKGTMQEIGKKMKEACKAYLKEIE